MNTQCTTVKFNRLLSSTTLLPWSETLFHLPLINILEIFKDFFGCRIVLAASQQYPGNIQGPFHLQNCLSRKSSNPRKYSTASTSSSNQQQQPATATNSSNHQQQPATATNSSNHQQQPATATNSSNQQQQSTAATSSSNQQQQPAAATSIHPSTSNHAVTSNRPTGICTTSASLR